MRTRKFEEIEVRIRAAAQLCDSSLLEKTKQKLNFALRELEKTKLKNSNKKTQEKNQINFPFPIESIHTINKEINKELSKKINLNLDKSIEIIND